MSRDEPFPLDYRDWLIVWHEWEHQRRGFLRPTDHRFGRKNILADSVLGVWDVNGRAVELSAVTMPAFGERPHRTIRFIGMSFGDGDSNLVKTFAELDEALGL